MASWEPNFDTFTDADWRQYEVDRFANGETIYEPLSQEELLRCGNCGRCDGCAGASVLDPGFRPLGPSALEISLAAIALAQTLELSGVALEAIVDEYAEMREALRGRDQLRAEALAAAVSAASHEVAWWAALDAGEMDEPYFCGSAYCDDPRCVGSHWGEPAC